MGVVARVEALRWRFATKGRISMDTDRQAASERYSELWDRIQRSEAYQVRARIETFRLTALTYRVNYKDLVKTLNSFRFETIPSDLTLSEFSDFARPRTEVICGKFYNYLLASGTLCDHERVLYRELYEPNNQISDYQCEIDSRFKNDGLSRLFQSLRNIYAHCRFPIVVYRHSVCCFGEFENNSIDFVLQKADLLSCDLNAGAKHFLRSLQEDPEILPLVKGHFKKHDEFYEWFSTRQAEVHQEAFAEIDRIESEMRALEIRLREYSKESGSSP